MKKATPKEFPSVSKSEVDQFPKSEALLLRLTPQDKQTITKAAGTLHLTVTEFLTKSALLVASKIPQKK